MIESHASRPELELLNKDVNADPFPLNFVVIYHANKVDIVSRRQALEETQTFSLCRILQISDVNTGSVEAFDKVFYQLIEL